MIDPTALRFADPLWLLALVLGPLALLAAVLRERRGHGFVYPGASRAKHLRRGWRVRLRHLPALTAALGLMLAAVAQARPQLGSVREDVTTQGVDIVVALDVSGSMAAEDFQPQNRLEVAKDVVAEFVTKRTHDRVGLVVFAGKSLTKAPPTTDTGVLLQQLADVKLQMLPDGTAIGSGLATSLTRLRRSKAKSKVVVLVTDGDNNAGEIDPGTAIDLAAAMQVRVYAVAVGRNGPVPMPVYGRNPITGKPVKMMDMVEMRVDEELLQRIASRTGGEFFRATDPETLRGIFTRIDGLEKSEIKLTAYRRYRELFPPVLAAAAAALLAAGALWMAGLRVVPA